MSFFLLRSRALHYEKGFFCLTPNRMLVVFTIGIFVALALRFDVSRKLGTRYFKSAFAGYAAGLILTIVVMNWFQAAQVSLALFF
jgi:hypothetical protein